MLRRTRRMRTTTLSFSILTSAVIISTVEAAPTMPWPRQQLIDAPVYGMVRPDAAFEVVKLWKTLFTATTYGKVVHQRIMAKLQRELKFDPSTPKGLATIGVNPSFPIWAAAGAVDVRRVELVHRQLGQMAATLKGKGNKAAKVRLPPPTFLRTRIVVPLSDSTRFKSYLGKHLSLLDANDKTGLAGQISRHVDGDASKAALADGLIKHDVLVFARPDRDAVVFLRIKGKSGVVDYLQSWWDLPRKLSRAAVDRALGALDAPAMPAAAASTELHRLAFAARPAGGAALFGRAKPLLRLAELGEDLRLLRIGGYVAHSGRTSDYWKMTRAATKRCQKKWKSARWMSSDVAFRATLTRRSWHAKAWWSTPRKLLRLLKGGVLSRDELIDPTVFKSTLALGGSNLDLGRVAGKLARGIFKERLRPFVNRLDECPALSLGNLATGGWVGLLGVALTEARAEPVLAAVIAKARNAVGLLRSMPSTRQFGRFSYKRPGSAMAHFVFGDASKVRAQFLSLAAKASLKPTTHTINGRKTMVLSPNSRWNDLALGLTELPRKRVGFTLGATGLDVRWFAGQTPPKSAIFPASIVAFGHVNLPALLAQFASSMSGIQGKMMGPMYKALADEVGRLGGNISLDKTSLTAELRLDRK